MTDIEIFRTGKKDEPNKSLTQSNVSDEPSDQNDLEASKKCAHLKTPTIPSTHNVH